MEGRKHPIIFFFFHFKVSLHFPTKTLPVFDSMPVLTKKKKGGGGEFSLIDLYSFSNELISQHNVIGFRGPLHIYDAKLQNIYNPNEIS